MEGAAVPHGALVGTRQWSDREAFAALYEEHVQRVYRHVYYFLGSHPEAEDITAQTFLQAWSAIGRYEDRGKPILSWLLTVAHNLILSRVRKKRRESPLHDGIPATARFTSPEEAYFAEWQQEEMAKAILKLKPSERQVILFRFIDNMDYPEVAGLLNKSVNAIRVIQYRALRNLRALLEEREDGKAEAR